MYANLITYNVRMHNTKSASVEGRINISIGNNSCATVPNYYVPTEFKSED